MRHATLAFVASSAFLCAQEPFQARAFLPNDYHNVVQIDLAKLRETGIWEELEAGVLKMFFVMMEKEAGFPLAALDRLTMIPQAAPPDQEGNQQPRQQQVLVFEGNTELNVPDRVQNNPSYAAETIGAYEVRRRNGWDDEVFFRPRPEVQIYGSTGLLRPLLEGKPSAGMPCADIMSLMSSRGGSLFYFVMHLADEQLSERALKTMFPDTEWPAGGGPQYLLLCLTAVGDPDDPEFELEAVLRHATTGDGIATTEQAVAGLIERGLQQPQLRLLAPLLRKVERARDGTDVTLEIALGRGRTAAGNLAMIMAPMMAVGTTVDAQPVPAGKEVKEVEVEEPPPPPPAKKGGGGAGGL